MSANQQTRNQKNKRSRSPFQRLSRHFMSSLLRSLFLFNKPTRLGQSGFVLPTTVLLLLVVSLTAGALSFRTFNRTQSAFLAREQQVIDNVAAPAIDRAKAKLEYLFASDNRLPGTGTPSSDVLSGLMNPYTPNLGDLGITALGTDPYTLPDEARLDLNNDGIEDNAWSFSFDLNSDGVAQNGEVIAYSLLMDDAVDPDGTEDGDRSDDIRLEQTGSAANELKANNLVTRNGPINTDETLTACGGSREPEQGWLAINSAALEKNFQITAFVSNGKNPGRANSAIELQQVRRALKGNRWGAWFKYDMELHPGPDFNWNGAIHSDGNVMILDDFRAHMISSHNSCLYTQESSQITMAEKDNNDDDTIDVNAGDFQGQLVLGTPGRGDGYGQDGGITDLHIFTNNTSAPKAMVYDTQLTDSNDSIQRKGGSPADQPNGNPVSIAVDPVALFSQDISRHRAVDTWERASNWDTNKYNTGKRVLNENVRSPYLDDFYRADDRYGPRPTYDTTDWVGESDDGIDKSDASVHRSSADYDKSLGEDIISSDPNADNLLNETSGLDGYWERQAIKNGMRVVVGQRIELGDANGWNFDAITNSVVDNADALYPPNNLGSTANKQKQRVTLRDNLAAVQGMVVYHYETNNGEYPLACMASTAHPGTLATLTNSRTFNTYSETGALKTDFLNGEGTNGWEFSFPTAFDTEAEFATAIGSTQPLGKALRNLAYFAGDPSGGAPSFTPVQEANGSTIVHPFPHQAMWGDFSILRRVFADYLDSGVTYNNLSFADKSALHSAACSLGLLAYNLEQEEAVVTAVLDDSSINWSNLGTKISNLSSKNQLNNGNPMIGRPADGTNLCTSLGATTPNYADPNWTGCPSQNPFDVTDTTDPQHVLNYFSRFSAEEWINALINDGSLDASEQNALELLLTGNQILRDRTLGFSKFGTVSADLSGNFDPTTGTWTNPSGGSSSVNTGEIDPGTQFTLSCDPELFSQGAVAASSGRAKLSLALIFCSYNTPAKYPALYYLFPVVDHDHDGDGNHAQPNTEEYVSQVTAYGVNSSVQYEALADADMTAIAFLPKANTITANALSTWTLPTVTTASAATLNPESMDIQLPDGKLASLPLLDKVMYNGREEMAVRTLDIDLGKLTRDTNVADYWISDGNDAVSGILYAAREDAKREDSIVRPAADTWANCNTLTELVSNTCYMDTSSATPEDPPLSRREDGTFVGISLKPVNFAPDPDRRPYGFRLNADLNGNNGDLSDRLNRDWGFTFVTDNAAYIKGEFNPHSTNGTDTIEEFTETLLDDSVGYGADFYDDRTTLNTTQFATDTVDRWRVAEVLADSVSILSSRFVDGSVEEGFIRNRSEVSSEFRNEANELSRTSFHNQQRPLSGSNRFGDAGIWLRINGVYPARDDSSWVRDGSNGGPSYDVPIWVGRNGESRTRGTNDSGTIFYRRFDNAEGDSADDKSGVTAEQVISGNDFVLPSERDADALINVPPALAPRVNATIISGLIPSRRRQGYGGLHNFPRFLERWEQDNSNKTSLFIQGAFLQLNFSTAATAPFDADSWDPGDTTTSSQEIIYYDPPARRWGYDVALQYSPAGPIAQRFVTIERPRSEHYREIPIEDPYVTNLRCAREKDGSSNWVQKFATEDCS